MRSEEKAINMNTLYFFIIEKHKKRKVLLSVKTRSLYTEILLLLRINDNDKIVKKKKTAISNLHVTIVAELQH